MMLDHSQDTDIPHFLPTRAISVLMDSLEEAHTCPSTCAWESSMFNLTDLFLTTHPISLAHVDPEAEKGQCRDAEKLKGKP